ncbi:MAG: hypothetical protein ACTHU0_10380 [Kofleriaceae bacterium]
MNELIEHIRAAVAAGATAAQKAIGAQACRTIQTALEAEPGKPIVLPGAPAQTPSARVSLDQVLDLVIARLAAVAAAQDSKPPHASPSPSRGLRIPTVQAAKPTPNTSAPPTRGERSKP